MNRRVDGSGWRAAGLVFLGAVSVGLAHRFPASADVLQSASYRQSLTWVGGTGGAAASASFRTVASLGQPLAGPLLAGSLFSLRAGFIQALGAASSVSRPLDPSVAYSFCLYPAYGSVCVDIPAGAFRESVGFSMRVPNSYPAAVSNIAVLEGTDIGVETSLDRNLPALKPLVYTFTYGDAYVAGRQENRLAAAFFLSGENRWLPVPAWVEAGLNRASVSAPRVGTVRLMEAVPSDSVDRVFVYPNPVQPHDGHTVMNFTNLPPGADIRLYTLAGEMVKSLTADDTGRGMWDVRNEDGSKVASGVYLALIRHGDQKTTVKIAVER
jgi:hypothetical protein